MSIKQYKNLDYWNQRYQNEDNFEWFKGYCDIKQILSLYLNKVDHILVLGCGNSPFSSDMYQEGYQNITNIDYSSVCIKKMKEKHKNCVEMEWLEMDMFDLQFHDNTFDVVIEKGTLDAALVEERDPWNISEEGFESIEKVLDEVSRVLKPNGRFLSITFSQPHFRKQFYCRSRYQWSYSLNSLNSDACFEYFVYAMKKGETLSESDQEYEKTIMHKRKHKEMFKSNQFFSNAHTQSIECDEIDDEFLLNISL